MKINQYSKSEWVSRFFLLITLGVILSTFNIQFVNADPSGAIITSNSTAAAPTYTPGNRSDDGGTINTLVLNVTQQDNNWKAYIGNISGILTLDDANGKTIYQWAMTNADITGEIYAAKINNPSWGSIACLNQANITAEDTTIGFTGTSVDSINKTFNETTHQQIIVAGNTITADTCRATATYVSDAKENQATATFQEVLFGSGSDIVYASPLNQGSTAYDDSTVDFQMMLADDVTAAATTYYFFVELG